MIFLDIVRHSFLKWDIMDQLIGAFTFMKSIFFRYDPIHSVLNKKNKLKINMQNIHEHNRNS